jgi:hypothetical protein
MHDVGNCGWLMSAAFGEAMRERPDDAYFAATREDSVEAFRPRKRLPAPPQRVKLAAGHRLGRGETLKVGRA